MQKKNYWKKLAWRVGSGTSIDIWRDNWLPKQFSFKIWTLKPQNTLVSVVSDLINHDLNCWDAQLVSSFFMPFEANQILQIPLSSHNQVDKLIWGPDRRWIFSVKSAYHFSRAAVDRNNEGQSGAANDSIHWAKLWSIRATPRHIHLVWRILHDKLPTRFALFKRGVLNSPCCARCNHYAENSNHIFMECEWSQMVWFACPLGIRFDDQIAKGVSFKDWLAEVIMQAEEKVLQLVFSICYGIWYTRNKWCFDQKNVTVPQVVSNAISAVEDFNSHNLLHGTVSNIEEQQQRHNECKWCPPDPDVYKLNVDAARPLNGEWGIRAIMRNHLGEVMAASRWKVACLEDVAVAEALALKTGLIFASDLFFTFLVAETDSSIVAAAMNSSAHMNDYMGLIIQDRKRCASNLSAFRCAHVRRQANQAAHGLARSALVNCDEIWMEEIPTCIADIIALDCSSILVE